MTNLMVLVLVGMLTERGLAIDPGAMLDTLHQGLSTWEVSPLVICILMLVGRSWLQRQRS